MPTWPAHQISLCKWVKTVLPGRYVIPDNGHSVAPQTPWAMVRLLSDAAIAPPERRTLDNAGDAKNLAITRRRAIVSITLAESAHHDDALELAASTRDPAILVLLETERVAIIRELSCVHLGADSDLTTQNRTVIDFEFAHTRGRISADTDATLQITSTGSYDPP